MRLSLLRVVCALCVLGVACRPQQPPVPAATAFPMPQVSGARAADGLIEPVRVVRDRWGVPHIYARNEHDLFFAQGFVQAQDRLFQMDLWRRSVQGRLSEVLGLNFVERDAATRRVQYRGDPGIEWASYGPGVKAIAEAFVAGINARVEEARAQVPEEFVLAGWLPEPWSAGDLLNRTDAFVATAADEDVVRARVISALGAQRAAAWLGAGAAFKIPAGLDVGSVPGVVGDVLRRAGTTPFFLGLAAQPVLPARAAGSNAWVVNGSWSSTGAPLLAADPHRAFSNPSLRYLVHLNAPGWNVIGATSPWLPGVVIGHNERVAWGMTAFPADVVDIFVEQVNPSDTHQVQHRGRWVNTTVVPDPIAMKGQPKPFPFEREYTPNGVIVATDSTRHLAFAMKWSGSEPGAAGELAALSIDRAQSADELRGALARWKLPAVEVVYASADGAGGRQVVGLMPNRTGWDGALPAPGWTGANQWRGWQRLEAMPRAQLPAGGGAAVSANRDPARTSRLVEIFSAERAYTLDDFRRLQLDTTAWNAGRLVPLLASVNAEQADVERARQRLLQWDRQVNANSAEAGLYVFWEEALARQLAETTLGPDLAEAYIARTSLQVAALTEPSGTWFDGNPLHARDRLLIDALTAAVARARAGAGDQLQQWGRLHALTFKHPLAISDATRRRFNVGPIELAGYSGTLLATYPAQEVTGGPSFRQIVDLSAWDRSLWTNAPGQSGSAGSGHYADLVKSWSAGEYFQMAFSEDAVKAVAESELVLQPK